MTAGLFTKSRDIFSEYLITRNILCLFTRSVSMSRYLDCFCITTCVSTLSRVFLRNYFCFCLISFVLRIFVRFYVSAWIF